MIGGRTHLLRPRLIAAALAVAMIPGAAQAQGQASPVSPATAPDPVLVERAKTLARLLNSEAIIIGTDKDDQAILALVPQMAAANPSLGPLEKQYPGITLEIARATLPITNRSARERLPQLWHRQAALYAAHFTVPELDTLIAFYQSPTGVKLIAVMQQAMHPTHTMAEMAGSPELHVGTASIMADIRDTVPDVLKAMTPDDMAVISRLAASGVLQKIRALAPLTQQNAIDWMAEDAPWEAAETERTVSEILERRRKAKQ